MCVNGSILLKNRRFIIPKSFNELIYGINTIIKCGIRQPVKFKLLKLAALIQRYDKNHFSIFDPVQERETN